MSIVLRKDLPIDVAEEILLRLPVEHVARCKFLSRTYRDFINTPSFINRHMRRHHQSAMENTSIVLAPSSARRYAADKIVPLLPPPPPSPPPHIYTPRVVTDSATLFYVVGSCNGLLCAVIKDIRNISSVLLWNPVSREHRILPQHNLRRQGFLGTGPATLDYREIAVGFGYDVANKDYKFVKIWRGGLSSHLEFWSMKTNKWREIEMGDPSFRGDVAGLPVRRSLYWLTHTASDGSLVPVLESFDMASDCFRSQATFPDAGGSGGRRGCRSIINFMGSLACAIDHGSVYTVWVMDNNENSSLWRKQFTIGTFPEPYRPVYFTRISTVDGKFLMEKERSKYFLYDPHSEEEEELLLPSNAVTEEEDCSFRPWSFIETVASPFVAA